MKRVAAAVFVAAIVAAGVLYLSPAARYVVVGKFEELTGWTAAGTAGSAGSPPDAQEVGGGLSQEARGMAGSAQNAVQQGLESAGQNVSQGVSGALDSAGQAVKGRIMGALGLNQNQSADSSVCAAVKVGESVSYSVKNPFADAGSFAVHVDWGDGASDSGEGSGGSPLTMSHAYGGAGDYTSAFAISSGGETATAKARTCVE